MLLENNKRWGGIRLLVFWLRGSEGTTDDGQTEATPKAKMANTLLMKIRHGTGTAVICISNAKPHTTCSYLCRDEKAVSGSLGLGLCCVGATPLSLFSSHAPHPPRDQHRHRERQHLKMQRNSKSLIETGKVQLSIAEWSRVPARGRGCSRQPCLADLGKAALGCAAWLLFQLSSRPGKKSCGGAQDIFLVQRRFKSLTCTQKDQPSFAERSQCLQGSLLQSHSTQIQNTR